MELAIDDVRPQLAQRFVGEPELLHRAGTEVVHDDIASLHHPPHRTLSGGRCEIDRDAALVAVEREERGARLAMALAQLGGHAEVTRLVAATGLLDLDD